MAKFLKVIQKMLATGFLSCLIYLVGWGSAPCSAQGAGTRGFVCASGLEASPYVFMYSIAPDGSLGRTGPKQSVMPEGLAWIYSAPDGKALYAFPISGDYILQYRVDAAGNISPAPNAKLQVTHPIAMKFDPYNSAAYVMTDDDKLLAFDVAYDDELIRDKNLDILTPPNTSPGLPAFSPGGKFMYVLSVYSNDEPLNRVGCVNAYASVRNNHPREIKLTDAFSHIGVFPLDLIADGRTPYLYAFKANGVETYKIMEDGSLTVVVKSGNNDGITQTVDAVDSLRHFFIGIQQNESDLGTSSNAIVVSTRRTDGSVLPQYTYYVDRLGHLAQTAPADYNDSAVLQRLSYDPDTHTIYALDIYYNNIYSYKVQEDGQLVPSGPIASIAVPSGAKRLDVSGLVLIPQH